MAFRRFLTIFCLLLLFPAPSPAEASTFRQWRTLFSLAHSLMNRVANARASRGDFSGSERARIIAQKLELGFGFSRGVWALGWDYLKNYSWRDLFTRPPEYIQILSDMNVLLNAVSELTRARSEAERAKWLMGNYQKFWKVSGTLLKRLLAVFSKSGPLQEMIVILESEVKGDLLRDCLEIGAGDLKGLLQVAKQIILPFVSSSTSSSYRKEL